MSRPGKIASDLARMRGLFDLEKDSLGRDLCKAATDGVQATIAAEQSPDGAPWAPLSERYEEWKSFQFPGNPLAVLHGTMANPHEVAGEITIRSDLARVTYGITGQAREEAEWFQEGDGNQPPRPFWGLTAASLEEVKKILEARMASFK